MMPEASGIKRKAVSPEADLPAKRATGVLVSEALLITLASSINAATRDLMGLPCTDIAARGRLVANMDSWERQLNRVLGIEQR
ncbi:hypothetical protein AAVH_37808, partial [Aphelenchoides avenae]